MHRIRMHTLRWILALTLIAPVTASAATLHFIIWADTLDLTIGTEQDLQNCSAWARTIESYTGLTLQLRTLTGQDLTPAAARQMLNSLEPAADDVVYFMYSGHGANYGDTQWPTLTTMAATNDAYVSLAEIVSILQPKAQRALIAMADCCNGTDDSGRAAPLLAPAAQSALTTANYQRLFLDFSGTIILSASKAGQYSLGDTSNGGLFTSTFLDTINTMAAETDGLTWEALLSKAATDTHALASSIVSTGGLGDMAPQEPQYTINGEQVASETPSQPDTNTTNSGATTDDGTNTPDATTPEEVLASPADNPTAGPASCGSAGPLPLAAMFMSLMFCRKRYRVASR